MLEKCFALGDAQSTPCKSSGLYISDFQDKSERGALKNLKKCSKKLEKLKKVHNGLFPIKKG